MISRVLDRYFFREVVTTFLAVTLVLLFILLSNQFARVLGQAAAGKLPREAVLTMLGLTSIQFLNILIPIALFLAIMLALGRLYRDSEMAAMQACTVGPLSIYRPLLLFAAILGALLAWLALSVGPWTANQAHVLARTAQRDAQLGTLEPGRFHSAQDTVFYAESSNPDGSFEDVFIEVRNGESVQVAVAARAEQTREADDLVTLKLFDGRRYEGKPGTPNFRVMEFREHGIRIQLEQPDLTTTERAVVPSRELIGSDDPKDIAELQWRYSLPLAAVVLTLLAVPLSRINPSQGRYGKLTVGVLLYVLYANLIGTARVWLERGDLPLWLGIWWVHGLFVLLALILLLSQNGWRGLWIRRRKPEAQGAK